MRRLAIKPAAVAVAASLILTSPGAAPYAAAGQASRAPAAVKLGVSVPGAGVLSPLQLPVVDVSVPAGLDLPALGVSPAAAPSVAAGQAASAAPSAAAQAAGRTAQRALDAAALDARFVSAELAAPASAPENAGQAAGRSFEGAKSAEKGEPVSGLSAAAAPTVSGLSASGRSPAAPRKTAKGLIGKTKRAGRILADTYKTAPPSTQKLLLAALAVGAAVLLPYYLGAAAAVPFVLATCNSMQEASIKEANILPQETDLARRQLAKFELDALLVEFGKDLRKAALAEARVQSSVSAHDAEHAVEEPLLDLLPKWRVKYEKGAGPSKEEAMAELRAAVLARLKKSVLTREDEALIEEIFDKAGGLDKLIAWEEKYGVLEALKKDAEAAAAKKKLEKEREPENGAGSSGLGTAGKLMGLAVLALGGLSQLEPTGYASQAFAAVSPVLGDPASLLTAGMMMLGMAAAAGGGDEKKDEAPKVNEPVALPAYLTGLGLEDEEAELVMAFTTDIGARDIAPIIGRSKEIQSVITTLSNPPGTQNNSMILGDKGVGKTAVVEAVAQYLYQNKLPSLSGKRILELDMGRLAAGAPPSELLDRLIKLMDIVKKTDNKVVLFIDEIHTLLKSVSTSSAVPDLLKTPLRNGEMTMIGATTLGEYRQYLEKDPAFADRFEPVQVDEPKIDEAIEMVEGSLEYLERKYQVEVDPSAADAAVRLSARYIPERFLPRKAHLLLRKAIAEAKPEAARDGLQVQIDQLTDRLRIFVKRYAKLAAAGDGGDAGKKAEIVRAHNRVISVYETILVLEDRQRALVLERITKEHVAKTLARETGLDVGELGADDLKKLAGMEPWFKERVVGQDEAVLAVTEAVRTNKAGLSDPDRPQGVFLFAGPTGVGKTEIARRLAEFLFNDPKAMVRLDMSEYMEKFSVQRMFGAPPGYVGYEEGGQLTEAVRRKPYSVVLLDEIEKAHPDVLLALLQVFEDGRMTDGKGNVVDFKNTIIIMTSNLGAKAATHEELIEILKARLRPELVNRVDRILKFNSLDLEQARVIAGIQTERVKKRLRGQDLELVVTDEALEWLARKGFNPDFGARPIKRTVESEITAKMSDFILAKKADGTLINGGVVTVTPDGNKLKFTLTANPPPSLELSPLPEGALGAKLRNILEEAVRTNGEGTGDLRKFEALLFPDRFEITLDQPMGAFNPGGDVEIRTGDDEERSIGFAMPAEVGVRDEAKERLRSGLLTKTAERWDEARREAAEAWLEAFTDLAKTLGSSPAPEGSFIVGAPESVLRVSVSAGEKQQLLRVLRDHLSVPLADVAAARKRAGDLKDEGKKPDLKLLEAKRLVEAVPGAKFGFVEEAGTWTFWLALPTEPKPDAPASEPAPAPSAAEEEWTASGSEPSQPASGDALPAVDDRPGAFRPLTLAKKDAVSSWGDEYSSPSQAADAAGRRLESAGFTVAAQDSARYWLTSSAALLEEAAGDDAPRSWSVVQNRSGSWTVEVSASGSAQVLEGGWGELARQSQADLDELISGIPDARYGYDVRTRDGRPELTFWLTLPASAVVQAEAPEPRITAADARTAPGKMLMFLAPRGGRGATRIGALRKLTASLLDSKATASRLLGLHIAAALLPKEGYNEVSAASRGVRVADSRDGALLAELAFRQPTGMTAQRKSVRDTFDTGLRSILQQARESPRRTIPDTNPSTRLYARFIARLGQSMADKESAAAREEARSLRRNLRVGLFWFGVLQAAVGGLFYLMAAFSGWNFWLLVALGVAASAGVWWGYSAWRTERASAMWENRDAVDRILAVGGAAKERRAIALSWLERASRGRLSGSSITPQEAGRAVAEQARDAGFRKTSDKLFAGWLDRLEKFLADPKLNRRTPSSAAAARGMSALAYMVPAMPEALRARAVNVLLAPLSDRWMPDSPSYAEGLGEALKSQPLEAAQIDKALDALTSFPVNSSVSRNADSWVRLLPILDGLAAQPSLDAGQRTGIDQLAATLAAESWERVSGTRNGVDFSAYVEAALIRARLGFGEAAWASLRDVVAARAANSWTMDEARLLARLIKAAPPKPLARAWIEPRLRAAVQSSGAVGASGRLALARLTDSVSDRVNFLAAAVTSLEVDAGEDPLYAEVIDDLHLAVAALRRQSADEASELDELVKANARRLSASTP